MNTWFELGTWNAICDSCGQEFKSHELRLRWDGMMVCRWDWEIRNPVDFFKTPQERISVPQTSPEPADTFVSVTYGSGGVQETTVPSGTFSGAL